MQTRLDKAVWDGAWPYWDFVAQMERTVEAGDEGLDERGKKLHEYTVLNLHRKQRAHRTYKVPEDVRERIAEIRDPQRWLVLTEDWCGDAAMTIPYVVEMVAENPNIELRILERDRNLDVMDQYLTNGNRSIPIMVAFDDAGNELFRWGPRPAEGDSVYQEAKAAGLPGKEVSRRLYLWFGRNRGKAMEQEILERIKKTVSSPV